MSRCFFRILLLALLLFPYLAAAEVITVPTDVPTIQGAIEAAGDGDVVRVNPGTYFESLNFLGKRITVESTDGPLATIITNDPEVDLVIFNHGESSQTVLEGFTLLGGYIGVWCQEAGPTIRHNIFIDQNTRFRAAIYLSGPGYAIIGDAPAVIENNTITGCTNNGIYSYSSAAPMVKNNIIINNSNYGIGRRRVGGVAGFYVSYNDVFGNTVDYYGVSDPGPGSISTDPLLTSSYTLSEDSPCIDAGDLDPTYNDPDGTRNDMGAISFIQVLPMAADINLYPEDPTHVVSLRPTFHWTFFDTLGSQEVFEVQVGIDPDWTVAEMWVSGEVHSADAYDVYAGAPLQDGETYFWRVRVNNGTSWGGWNMSSFKMNRAPSTPTAIFPMDYNSISVTSVHLVWTGCSDADPDPVTYEFEIYTDPLLSNLVVHKSGIVGQGDEISSGVIDDLTPGVYYWWRVCAYDGYERSWSVTNAFRTQTAPIINVPADQPSIQAGINAANEGDIVLVAPGTYQESLDFTGKMITVKSAEGPQTTVITGDSSTDLVVFDEGETPGSRLEGFKLQGGRIGIWCQDAAPTIRRNLLVGQNISDWAAIMLGGPGMGVAGDAPAIIENNTVIESDHGGICSFSRSSPRIKNNIVAFNGGYGIALSELAEVVELDLSYNNLYENSQDCIAIADPGAGSISADPAFGFDYVLSYNSPCIDAGDPDSTYRDPDGTLNDMGAIWWGHALPLAGDLHMGPDDPAGVASHVPTFYWTFVSSNGEQAAYEIEAGTDPEWSTAEMWASGEVSSSDAEATYAGLALEDGHTYFYRVRVNDGSSWGDWTTSTFYMNQAPTAPTALSPVGHSAVSVTAVSLLWTACSDADSDPLTYEFEIYDDPSLTNLVARQSGITGDSVQLSSGWLWNLEEDKEYWWRVCAFDGFERSWSALESFVTQPAPVIHVPVDQPSIQAGINAANEGDIVLVAPGTYEESIVISGKMITLKSSEGPLATIITNDASTDLVVIDGTESSPTRLEGFTLLGGRMAVWCKNSAPAIRRNILIDQNEAFWGAISLGGESYGSFGYSPAVIENNTIVGAACDAISIFSKQAPIIRNNIISFNHGCGISRKEDVRVPQVTPSYNDVYDNSPDYEGITEEGPGSISYDPLFCFVYVLEYNSPCVDAGDPDIVFNDPDGTRSDMGAIWLGHGFPLALGFNLDSEDASHVVSHTPTFQWVYLDTLGEQTAYEVEVGTDLDWTTAEMWASGEISSFDTNAVYTGLPLEDGKTYFYRIRVNNGTLWGTWRMSSFRMNSVPSVPAPLAPVAGAAVPALGAELLVTNSTDSEDDSLKYEFEMFDVPTLTNLVLRRVGVHGQQNETGSRMVWDMPVGQTYWWRVRSYDGYEWSEWSAAESFLTNPHPIINVPADQPTIQAGIDAATDNTLVLVAPGTYSESLDFLGKMISVKSSGGPLVTTITNEPEVDLVVFSNDETPASRLEGFALLGGHGAVWCRDAGPTIRRNLFLNQDTPNGVAIMLGGDLWSRRGYSPAVIESNTIIGMPGIAIASYSYSTPIIRNNIVAFGEYIGIYRNYRGAQPDLDYNCVFGNRYDYSSIGDSGASSISVDPLFNPNYALSTLSPCIDAGDPDPWCNDPDGSRSDMGAIPVGYCCVGLRGNVNYDPEDKITVSDLTYLITYLYGIPTGPRPGCIEEGNVNGDQEEKINISDAAYLLTYLFGTPAGPAPPPCPSQ